MKKKLWLGAGLVSTCLTASLVGQKVWGQPDLQPPPSVSNYSPAVRPIPSAPLPGGTQNTTAPRQVGFNPNGPDVAPGGPGVPLPPPAVFSAPPPGLPGGVPVINAEPILNNPTTPQPVVRDRTPNDLPKVIDAGPAVIQGVPSVQVQGSPIQVGPAGVTSPLGNASIETKPGRQEPSVSIEWVVPQMGKLGQPMPCQILVRNTGPVLVHNVNVKHTMATGVTHRQSEPVPLVENNHLTWTLGTLEPGQTKRIDVQLISQLKGAINCQAQVTFTGASSAVVQVREPLLQLKVKGPEKIVAGEAATIMLHLSNPGDGPTENIKIKTVLPEGLEHTRGRSFEVEVGNLAPKEARTMQLVCQAKGAGIQQAMLVATAEGGLTANDSCTMEILLPKLDLVVAGPKLRFIDRKATYVLKVANPGSAPAQGVTLTEVVPAGFRFHAASQQGRFEEGNRTVTWFLGDIQPGQNREVQLDLIAKDAGDYRLQAQVNSARGTKTDHEMRTVVEGLSSLLVEVFDADDPLEVGAETTYQIRVKNEGSKIESNLEVVCTLPEQVEFKGAKSTANSRFRVEGREVLFEVLPRLTRDADVIYTIQVRGLQAGNAIFRATVRGEGVDPIVREERTRIYNDDLPPR